MGTEDIKLGRSWDDTVWDLTDELKLGRKIKKPSEAPKKSSWTGAGAGRPTPDSYPGKGTREDVVARLNGVAKKTRQVMVKITPGKNSKKAAVLKHLKYIGEDGKGVVYDQDGRQYAGDEVIEKELMWQWEHVGPKMPDESDTRLAYNIMFSMPEGTDERAVFEAVKKVASIEFAGHQWVMGQHFDEPQVHCHVAVKAVGMDGTRLNPRKEDLIRWRERFAYELRERGVEAEATSRALRLQRELKDKPWSVVQMQSRGEATNPMPPSIDLPRKGGARRVEKWRTNEAKTVTAYAGLIESLSKSKEAADQIVARELQASFIGKKVKDSVVERDIERSSR